MSSNHNSRYFNQTRSHYLYTRIRAIAMVLALIQPAWILVDYYLIPDIILADLIILRLVTAVVCLLIGGSEFKPYELRITYIRLFLLVLTLSVFQTAVTSLLLEQGTSNTQSGYDFFPFMIISMLAIFPLTIIEVLIYIGGVFAAELVTQSFRGELGSMQGVNHLWLLAVLGLIAGWAAVNQVNTLLSMYRQAVRDPLTGLSNRRQAKKQMVLDFENCRAKAKPVSVLLFDLDKFKRLNDNYGHAAGDLVLKNFADLIRATTNEATDLCCRFGGEEFLIALPGRSIAEAEKIAEAIRLACHDQMIITPAGELSGYSTSIGVAELKPEEDIENLLHRVDKALYAAKNNGRDQLALAA